MFVGHLAVAFGAKAVERRAPLALFIAASFGIDLLWPIFLLIGIESVGIDPGNTAFTALDFSSYPWTHSLLMASVWAVVFGGFAYRIGALRKAAVIAAAVVVSHWILDWITHRPDLPLWPGGTTTGLGLWNSIAGTLLLEGLLLVIGVSLYIRSITFKGMQGKAAFVSLLILTVAIWASQPWSPPPPDPQAVAMVGLSMWLLPLWGYWIDRNTVPGPPAT